MTSGTVRDAATVVRGLTGLRLDAGLLQRLRRAVAVGAAAAGTSEEEFVRELPANPAALAGVISAVTIQESAWFRDEPQFEVFRTVLLPRLRVPVVWSIGAGLGQEAFSLGIALAEAGREDVRVVATDISPAAVAACSRGVFATPQLRGLDTPRRERWLRPVDDAWEVDPALRNRVVCLRHNVAEDAVPAEVKGCEVVFCRNVLIYLTDDAIEASLERLVAFLPDGGALFLGGGEALWRALRHFRPVETAGCYYYRPRWAPAPAIPPPTQTPPTQTSPTQTSPTQTPPTQTPPTQTRPTQALQPKPTPPAPSSSEPDPIAIFHAGTDALDDGRQADAVRLLRQAAYLDPDLPVAHFALGVALARGGDAAGARRAWEAARTALDRADPARLEDVLDGHSVAGLRLAIEARLRDGR